MNALQTLNTCNMSALNETHEALMTVSWPLLDRVDV